MVGYSSTTVKIFTHHLVTIYWLTKNPKGLWRKTTLTSYQSPTTEWTTVLDLDELARKEEASHTQANVNACFNELVYICFTYIKLYQ
jgi:prolyl oligopeptidase PreP (S9A serine peptidase family)